MLQKLIGKQIQISVGEPWDFVSEAGKNLLIGSVTLVSDKNETEWVKCNVSTFFSDKNKVTSLVAVHRYADQFFEVILKGEQVTANFLYDPNGKDLDSRQVSEILKKQSGARFLVGSIQLSPC